MSQADEALERAEELLARLEATRARARGDARTPTQAIEILTELAEIAKEVEAELEQARREAADASA